MRRLHWEACVYHPWSGCTWRLCGRPSITNAHHCGTNAVAVRWYLSMTPLRRLALQLLFHLPNDRATWIHTGYTWAVVETRMQRQLIEVRFHEFRANHKHPRYPISFWWTVHCLGSGNALLMSWHRSSPQFCRPSTNCYIMGKSGKILTKLPQYMLWSYAR